ncbi:MAG: metal ABC transporter ATP-binding protein [Bacteroidales bacterium]
MKTLVKLDNISAGYEGKNILEKVNLEIKEKDFVGIIGPNGGGKTTLLKVILGLISPNKGSIRYYFSEDKQDFRKFIGYLPQQSSIDKKFPISVREVVLSGLISGKSFIKRYNKKDMKLADDLMEKTGLAGIWNKPVGELSGGQMQRVFLARALVSSPKLLILDEPDTFVDNRFEQELYETLRELNEEIAILLVSHDVGTISSYIKTIACVNGNLHYHSSNVISSEQLKIYNCPIDIIAHGPVPHRVLHEHKE